MNMNASYSPLRYPGGKRKLTNYLSQIIVKNDLIEGTYVEPFAGGANIALSLLFEKYVSKIRINDIDPVVFTFWDQVLNNNDQLCQRIHDTKVTMEEWHRQKDIFRSSDVDPLDAAFSLFFLNRTNRSGILRAGVIGGKDQTGKWKLDARFNKSDLVLRIQKIGRHASNIQLTNLHAEDLLKEYTINNPRTLIYLDPPYYVKGGELYTHNFKHEDHLSLSKLMQTINNKWIVSYDFVKPIDKMYGSYSKIVYGISYSAQDRYRGTEVMFFSDGLVVPEYKDPTKAKRAVA